ncbi:MAG: ribosome maturation factor RimP [Geminicoccaceae bacterium]|nr:ribosome maturation factor RimP [Geminicoccaceae bacterium]MCS7268800.1 ribosome maturation factor RimP [Geminicoccaceae bacterium]MCX7630873.1 ribosome maturation factor RimP [Geminicoccaceae bacterium]MDW8125867.1 ribosome maturation factor RimP [Geminicoccaceae bacterium]MDW8340500.1 ribosome maturation factor RimP [Geminicoccaceae bacterium]
MKGISSSTDFAALVRPTLAAMGFELVEVRLVGGGRPTLQVVAEPADHSRAMSVDDCAAISHALSAVLDVADPVSGPYRLEVSSPGIERPLVTAEHFRRFAGQRARVETQEPIAGRRRFTGVIRACDDTILTLETEEGTVSVPLASLRRARLAAEAAAVRGRRSRG